MKRSIDSTLDANERGLSKIIANSWHGEFAHSFKMPQRRGSASLWWKWRQQKGWASPTWTCSNLSDAAMQYQWDDVTNSPSETLRTNIIDAIGRQDFEAVKNRCLEIFDWGGVGRKQSDRSRIWVTTTSGPDLIAGITRAVELLRGANNPAQLFDGKTLLMNSAMTKIYAFADPTRQLAIYDGRVGAALGVFVVQYCRIQSLEVIPIELNFGWHDSIAGKGYRDPSRGNYKFPRLTKGDGFHARCMWRANRIMQAAAQDVGCSVLEMERALFMVGYDLSQRH